MQILVIAATSTEIAPFLDKFPAADHLITGVGAPVSVYQIAKRLHQMDYDLVIQAGIAGSFTTHLRLGEVVLVEKDSFADIGVLEKNQFTTVFEMGLAGSNDFPFNNGWLVNDQMDLFGAAFKRVAGVTVNSITAAPESAKHLVEKWNPGIESMEGAALHFVCLQEKIPFLQIRGISNYVGERNKAAWKLKEAIDNVNTALESVVEQFIHHSKQHS